MADSRALFNSLKFYYPYVETKQKYVVVGIFNYYFLKCIINLYFFLLPSDAEHDLYKLITTFET